MRALFILALSILFASCTRKDPAAPVDLSGLGAKLEEIAKLERKDEVLRFWKHQGWSTQPQLRDDLVKQGLQVPDRTYYPFVERYGAGIPLATSGRHAILQVYLDQTGWVTYRTIEVINVKP